MGRLSLLFAFQSAGLEIHLYSPMIGQCLGSVIYTIWVLQSGPGLTSCLLYVGSLTHFNQLFPPFSHYYMSHLPLFSFFLSSIIAVAPSLVWTIY